VTTYSYSRLNVFKSCPFAYKLAYVDRVPPTCFVEVFAGKRVHEALEKLYVDLLAGRTDSLEELLAFHDRRWREEWSDSVIVPAGGSAAFFKERGEKCLRKYFYWHSPFTQAKTVGVERRVFTRAGRHSFVGVVDRIALTEQGVYEVHDYKTSSVLPSEQYFLEDEQLAMYQLALQRELGWKDVELVWDFVALGKQVRVKKSLESLDKTEKRVISLIERVEESVKEGEFEKREGEQCRHCAYSKQCKV